MGKVWKCREQIHNPNINYGEFAIIRSNAGLNSFKISVKEWTEKENTESYFKYKNLLYVHFMVDISSRFAYNKYEMALYYHNYDKEMIK